MISICSKLVDQPAFDTPRRGAVVDTQLEIGAVMSLISFHTPDVKQACSLKVVVLLSCPPHQALLLYVHDPCANLVLLSLQIPGVLADIQVNNTAIQRAQLGKISEALCPISGHDGSFVDSSYHLHIGSAQLVLLV